MTSTVRLFLYKKSFMYKKVFFAGLVEGGIERHPKGRRSMLGGAQLEWALLSSSGSTLSVCPGNSVITLKSLTSTAPRP